MGRGPVDRFSVAIFTTIRETFRQDLGGSIVTEIEPTGRVVKIFITGDDPRSLRHVELDNWSGLAVTGQPEYFKKALETEELRRSCVYLLIQTGGEDDLPRVYVGESDDFTKRYPGEKFPIEFDTFMIFTSKDDNLTRAHVKWLELHLWQMLTENVGKVAVANANRPSGSNLPRPDRATMSTYLGNMIYVLEALGFDLFTKDERSMAAPTAGQADESDAPKPSASTTFQTTALPRSQDALAYLEHKDGTYLLKAGSKVSPKATESLPGNVRRLRDQLLADSILIDRGEFLELTKDISFSKPSPASALVKGRSSTGHGDWVRSSDGLSLGRALLGVFD